MIIMSPFVCLLRSVVVVVDRHFISQQYQQQPAHTWIFRLFPSFSVFFLFFLIYAFTHIVYTWMDKMQIFYKLHFHIWAQKYYVRVYWKGNKNKIKKKMILCFLYIIYVFSRTLFIATKEHLYRASIWVFERYFSLRSIITQFFSFVLCLIIEFIFHL